MRMKKVSGKVLNSPEMKNRELASTVTVDESYQFSDSKRREKFHVVVLISA